MWLSTCTFRKGSIPLEMFAANPRGLTVDLLVARFFVDIIQTAFWASSNPLLCVTQNGSNSVVGMVVLCQPPFQFLFQATEGGRFLRDKATWFLG